MDQLIIVYDSDCLFCSRFIQYVYENDLSEKIKFSDFKSKYFLGLRDANRIDQEIDSILFVENNQIFIYSDAILKIMITLNRYKLISRFSLFIPKFFRDTVYRLIAKKRYFIFGEANQCLLFEKKRTVL